MSPVCFRHAVASHAGQDPGYCLGSTEVAGRELGDLLVLCVIWPAVRGSIKDGLLLGTFGYEEQYTKTELLIKSWIWNFTQSHPGSAGGLHWGVFPWIALKSLELSWIDYDKQTGSSRWQLLICRWIYKHDDVMLTWQLLPLFELELGVYFSSLLLWLVLWRISQSPCMSHPMVVICWLWSFCWRTSWWNK